MVKSKLNPQISVDIDDVVMSGSSYVGLGQHPPNAKHGSSEGAQVGHMEKMVGVELGTIFNLCNQSYEPLVVNYSTGIRHQRLFSIQRYLTDISYSGNWIPFVEYLQFVALPRLIPRSIIVQGIKEDLDLTAEQRENRNHGGWLEWFEAYGLDGDSLDVVNTTASAETIYDFILSHFQEDGEISYTLKKPTTTMKDLRIWGGNVAGNQKISRENYFHKDWMLWDIVIPKRFQGSADLPAHPSKMIAKNQYGYFNSWWQLLRGEYPGHELLTPFIDLYGDDGEYGFLAGLMSIFTTPLMYEGFDFKRNFRDGAVTPLRPSTLQKEIREHTNWYQPKWTSSNWSQLTRNPFRFKNNKDYDWLSHRMNPPYMSFNEDGSKVVLSPLWYLMAAINRWFPVMDGVIKDEIINSVGYVADLREDNTLNDIVPIEFNGVKATEGNNVGYYDDYAHSGDIMLLSSLSEYGTYGEKNIKAMGGFIQLNDGHDPLKIGLGNWNIYDSKIPLKSYKYDEIISPYSLGSIRVYSRNPTPVIMDINTIKRTFIFVPKRPLDSFYGLINYSALAFKG